jgi:F-type H+-transporting ATPase subunit epsilon
MTARSLVLEIVTPDGCVLVEDGVEVVVLRRREVRFERGSEIAVFPRHAPMLLRMPIAPVRYRRGGETVHLAVAGGFAEVKRDRVHVLTPRCERIPRGAAAPRAAASGICLGWARELKDFRAAMVGAG